MAADHLPFDGSGARTCQNPHDADGDVYREAFDALRDRAGAAGVQVVMTGFGGDEMLALRHAERSTPLVAPAQPGLLRLGEALPAPWRAGKALLRSRLERVGFGPGITRPTHPESFTSTMDLALRRNGIPTLTGMLRESILVDLGYVDHAVLAEQLRRAETGHPIPGLLYDTLAVETGLRSMTGNPRRQP